VFIKLNLFVTSVNIYRHLLTFFRGNFPFDRFLKVN